MALALLHFPTNGTAAHRFSLPSPFPATPGGTRGYPQDSRALPATTDFTVFTGMNVLCLVDEDNLRISLQRHGVRLSYRTLLARLTSQARRVAAWAVLTAAAGDSRREAYLAQRGWDVLTIPQEVVMTVDGPCKKANADLDLCFTAGALARAKRCEAVLLGTGDGDLAIAIARGIKRLHAGRAVYTLSVPGSTSHRLRNAPDLFAGNLLIGEDITRGIS